MFSFGFPELILIAVVVLLVVGPQDIPKVMYALGKAVQRLRYIRYIFTKQFDDFMQEAELNDIREKSEHINPDQDEGKIASKESDK